MKTIFTLALTFITTLLFAGSHEIIKQNGEKLDVNYVITKDNTVYYSLPGSSALNEISTFAVNKVIEKSTTKVLLDNSKTDVSGESGYKNVQFLLSDQTKGLAQGVTLNTTIHKAKGQSASDWKAQAHARIQKQAAAQGFPFVVITTQTDSKIVAVAYGY